MSVQCFSTKTRKEKTSVPYSLNVAGFSFKAHGYQQCNSNGFFILHRPWISFFYLLATLVVLNSKKKKKTPFLYTFFLICVFWSAWWRGTLHLRVACWVFLLLPYCCLQCEQTTQSTSVYTSQVPFIHRCVIESSLQWSWLCWNSYYSKGITEPFFLHIQNTTYSTRLSAQITWSQSILLVRRSLVFWMIFSSCSNNSLGRFLYLVPVVAWTTFESVILRGDFSSCAHHPPSQSSLSSLLTPRWWNEPLNNYSTTAVAAVCIFKTHLFLRDLQMPYSNMPELTLNFHCTALPDLFTFTE